MDHEIDISSKWREKYDNVSEYWMNFDFLKEYEAKGATHIEEPEKYFTFDEYQLTIDPDETIEDLEEYTIEEQEEEIKRCSESFPYFAQKFVKILHPRLGLIPFIIFNYQRKAYTDFENHRFNIISKFRQGGLTTLAELWSMWRCMFKLDQQILFLSKTDSEAIAAGEIVNTASKYLPTWMQPAKDGKWNDHKKEFPETSSKMHFGTPERARGLAITYLILDEAAFIPYMEEHWKAMYPVLSTGGNAIIISTVNGMGNWYEETYHNAEEGKNKFHIIDLDYWEHPYYNNEKWIEDQKAQLGEKGWLQEVLRSFLDSGETYISAQILTELQKQTRKIQPYRKLFQKYANRGDTEDICEKGAWEVNGAMWVYKEPKEGHEYIMSVDCSEGVGDEGDNSCIQILDAGTLEQVGEFYSNNIPPYVFAQVCNELGIYYNHALLVVENMGIGGAVLGNLQYELYYDNLHFDDQGKSMRATKPGIKIGTNNRTLILESMQRRIMNGSVKINSPRLVRELNTFVYDRKKNKVEARRGKHDDAIMAFATAIFIRDSIMREVPVGGETNKNLDSPLKSATYEEIKKEIMEGSVKDFLDEELNVDPLLDTGEESTTGIVYNFRRKADKILKEFGWSVLVALIGGYSSIV